MKPARVTELQVLDGQVAYGGDIANAVHALRPQSDKTAEAIPLNMPPFGETGLLGDDRRRSRHCDGRDGTAREVGCTKAAAPIASSPRS